MKNGKKATVAQRNLMVAHDVNPNMWFVSKDTSTEMILISKNAKGKPRHNQVRVIDKGVLA
ncbi:DUF6906 family protein [Bacillus sp. Hm123]|uniref:DUF6906 family protein n=1 Tax=Bacillus sp. Hm123 TaxID=3450745 RepID=UPI003F43FB67